LGYLQRPSGLRSENLMRHAIQVGIAVALKDKMAHGGRFTG
jgi:hypothetical protein